MEAKDINKIFIKCLATLGGENNEHVHWYLNERPKRVSRKSFFHAIVWAVWVTGLKEKSTSTFLERAEECGFNWNFEIFCIISRKDFRQFMIKLHDNPIPNRARKKWETIYEIAQELSELQSEQSFRDEFFYGKKESNNLNEEDAMLLIDRKMPFIKKANASFITRNMGGEAIKCDRWIEAFLNRYRISVERLMTHLEELGIDAGFFDIVMWAYCTEYVKKLKDFNQHFKEKFS